MNTKLQKQIGAPPSLSQQERDSSSSESLILPWTVFFSFCHHNKQQAGTVDVVLYLNHHAVSGAGHGGLVERRDGRGVAFRNDDDVSPVDDES
jgi:hypothetical protein